MICKNTFIINQVAIVSTVCAAFLVAVFMEQVNIIIVKISKSNWTHQHTWYLSQVLQVVPVKIKLATWRNFRSQMWRNPIFLHIPHAEKVQISPQYQCRKIWHLSTFNKFIMCVTWRMSPNHTQCMLFFAKSILLLNLSQFTLFWWD